MPRDSKGRFIRGAKAAYHRARSAVRRPFARKHHKLTLTERADKPLTGIVVPAMGAATAAGVVFTPPPGGTSPPLVALIKGLAEGDMASVDWGAQNLGPGMVQGAVNSVPAIIIAVIAGAAGKKLRL